MVRMLALAAALLAVVHTAEAQSSTPPPTNGAPAPTTAQPAAPGTKQAAPTAMPPAQPAPVVAQPAPVQPPPAQASKAPVSEPQPTRRLYTWGSIGTTFAYGETYGNANVGVGWLLRAGLAPNVEGSYMFGNSPNVFALRPGVTWFVPMQRVRPYVGAYYTHWFVTNNRPDQDGVGARAGVSLGPVLSLGVTYDRALGCDSNCDMWTPQISAGFSM